MSTNTILGDAYKKFNLQSFTWYYSTKYEYYLYFIDGYKDIAYFPEEGKFFHNFIIDEDDAFEQLPQEKQNELKAMLL